MESSPEVQSLLPQVDFGCMFQLMLFVVVDDVGEGSCVDVVGWAVAVILCPLVDGALEEVGSFRPYCALDLVRVDGTIGSWVEAEPKVAWVFGRWFRVGDHSTCVGWEVWVGVIFRMDGPEQARLVGWAESVYVVAVRSALLAP